MKIGYLVRFNHQKDGGPVHKIVSVMADGMVEINDMDGYFAADLFAVADDIGDIPPVVRLPIYSEETLIGWADKIDGRLGPISGGAADQVAVMLRATATRLRQLRTDRDDQDRALADAIRETAATADELAFWRYQAIWYLALVLYGKPMPGQTMLLEGSAVWKEATRQLEAARVEENRERMEGR